MTLSVTFSSKIVFMLIILAVLLIFMAYNWSVVLNLWSKISGLLQSEIASWNF